MFKNFTIMRKFKVRMFVIYHLLFKKWKHWTIITINDDSLIKFLKDKDYDIGIALHGMPSYVFYSIIKSISNTKSDVDMICEKANFEASAEEYNNLSKK